MVRRLDGDGNDWDEFNGETVDLSAGGVLLSADELRAAGPPRRGGRCTATRPRSSSSGRGRVVRSWRKSTGSWLSGVCFERLTAHAERELLRFCFLKEREMAERVSNVRIEIAIPARLQRTDGTIHRASTVNICADGGRVTAPWDADRGEAVVVSFSEEWFGRELTLRAQVGRRDERGFDLEFTRPDARRPRCDQPADHG